MILVLAEVARNIRIVTAKQNNREDVQLSTFLSRLSGEVPHLKAYNQYVEVGFTFVTKRTEFKGCITQL
ncbi:hypothetical protein QO000_003747 [Alkalihalobacillus hemicentroti]|uniref:Uncharacterized protein n=1 Tax=Guptibacillus hwajinpoensis TaxID=208199 RepID=A0ABU0K5V6_9BACL|nr:hypothetical protein [Alkalihalobacillus hemicentroti]